MIYRSLDKRFAIMLPLETYKEIEKFCNNAHRKETGGIIIGKYEQNQSLAAIVKISGPPEDSTRKPTWFTRGISGLKKLLDDYWNEGFYYLGEWHYHPDAPPTPSHQDIAQMTSIATSKSYQCPEPILIITGKKKDLFTIRVFVSLKGKQLLELYLETS